MDMINSKKLLIMMSMLLMSLVLQPKVVAQQLVDETQKAVLTVQNPTANSQKPIANSQQPKAKSQKPKRRRFTTRKANLSSKDGTSARCLWWVITPTSVFNTELVSIFSIMAMAHVILSSITR